MFESPQKTLPSNPYGPTDMTGPMQNGATCRPYVISAQQGSSSNLMRDFVSRCLEKYHTGPLAEEIRRKEKLICCGNFRMQGKSALDQRTSWNLWIEKRMRTLILKPILLHGDYTAAKQSVSSARIQRSMPFSHETGYVSVMDNPQDSLSNL